MCSRMTADGIGFDAQSLHDRQWMVTAAVARVYGTSSAVGAVASCCTACHRAMRMNRTQVIMQKYDSASMKASKPARKMALEKAAAVSLKET